MQILRDRPKDFLVVSGDDALAFPQNACGMEGVISVAANAFPKEFSNMFGWIERRSQKGTSTNNFSWIHTTPCLQKITQLALRHPR